MSDLYGVDEWRQYAVEVHGADPERFDALTRLFEAANRGERDPTVKLPLWLTHEGEPKR